MCFCLGTTILSRYELFRARIFNGDPHPGNILITPDQQIGLIDYGQCKRLTKAEVREFAQLIVAIGNEAPDQEVADAMRGCGFVSRDDNTEFLASFGRLIFSHIRPEYADPQWHRNLHTSDGLLAFPRSLLLVSRTAGILRGIGLSFMHNLSIADLWAVHAQAVLDGKEFDFYDDEEVALHSSEQQDLALDGASLH